MVRWKRIGLQLSASPRLADRDIGPVPKAEQPHMPLGFNDEKHETVRAQPVPKAQCRRAIALARNASRLVSAVRQRQMEGSGRVVDDRLVATGPTGLRELGSVERLVTDSPSARRGL